MFGTEKTENLGFLRDISNTGMKIKSICQYEIGAPLTFNIYDDETDEVMFAECHVAWSRKASTDASYSKIIEMGVQFIETDPALKKYTRSLMTS